ncbi:phospholipase A1 2, partial [Asbolus verrucosus]
IKCELSVQIKEDIFAIYTHAAFKANEIIDEHVTPDKVNFFLFTRRNPQNYTEIDPSAPEELSNTTSRIVFIIHGWLENRAKQWYEDLKNAFLNRNKEYYVIQVDWSDPALKPYVLSSHNTKDVGEWCFIKFSCTKLEPNIVPGHIIGNFVVDLHKNYSIPLDNFLIVGHSLGGQISGYIGKKVKELSGKRLPRIVALDPAGPLFINRPEDERLNKNDAEVVHVIHTNGGTFGFEPSCGTIDFFPNGGSRQPGCAKIDLLDITTIPEPVYCHHQRSWKYFIEAVLNPGNLVATKCKDWSNFKAETCEPEQVAMGDLETKKTGDFYLETNDEKPFAKKNDETKLENIIPKIST